MADLATPGLLDRAIRRITDAWRDMAASVAPAEDESIPAQMRACLAARGGEVSARNRAAKLGEAYLAADASGRLAFLRDLASFDSDRATIAQAATHLAEAAEDPAARAAATAALRRALQEHDRACAGSGFADGGETVWAGWAEDAGELAGVWREDGGTAQGFWVAGAGGEGVGVDDGLAAGGQQGWEGGARGLDAKAGAGDPDGAAGIGQEVFEGEGFDDHAGVAGTVDGSGFGRGGDG